MRRDAVALLFLALGLSACAENAGSSVIGGPSMTVDGSTMDLAPPADTVDVSAPPDRVDAVVTTDATDAAAVDAGCTGDEACAATAGRPVCDRATGACVACLVDNDRCPPGRYCAARDLCAEGCRDDGACAASAGDGGSSAGRCEPTTRRCVACVTDAHCPAGSLCVGNLCVPGCNATRQCPAGQTCCGGGCVDPQSNIAHCGGCGTVCTVANAAPACLNGTCGVGACTAPFADCDRESGNGCEANTQTSVAHCGGCGSACAVRANATASCEGGACRYACNPGFADCDGDPANGCEVDTRTSTTHCGACARRCDPANATAACVAGTCTIASCNPGFGDCDGNAANGCETDTRTSTAHCGGCGMACGERANSLLGCAAARCVLACLAGFADCDAEPANGCEVDIRTSVANCGSCGRVCRPANASATCVAAQCRVAACTLPFENCDNDADNGCEANTQTSAAHCGRCGNACPARANATPTCSGASCGFACNPGFADCDNDPANGCEVDTRTSPSHCGRCGNACASGVCAGSTCQAPSCSDGVRNGGESDVDCGGSTCPRCARCRACSADADCADGACGAAQRCTVRRDVTVNWLTNCRGPGGGNAPVTVGGLPAGNYDVTPLRSAATVWNPVSFPSNGWLWSISCDNFAAPTLSTGGTFYPTPEAAFAVVAGRTARARFAGGDLVCAFADNPCSDNQGAISFRMELVCE